MTRSFALFRSTLAATIAATATLFTIAGSAAPARAAEARTISIETSGIDLASPAGAARIEAQIGRAARQVCSTSDDRSAAATMARHACIKAALAGAMPDFDQLAADAREARTAVAEAAPATAPVRR
jgi:UrcA family protein